MSVNPFMAASDLMPLLWRSGPLLFQGVAGRQLAACESDKRQEQTARFCRSNAGDVKFEADRNALGPDEEDTDATKDTCPGHCEGPEAAALST